VADDVVVRVEASVAQGSLLPILERSIDAAAVPTAGIGLKVLLISSLEDVIDGRIVFPKGTPRDVLASLTGGVVDDVGTSRLDGVSDGRSLFPLCRDFSALRDDGNITGLLDTKMLVASVVVDPPSVEKLDEGVAFVFVADEGG
jgi:hypothetical protein